MASDVGRTKLARKPFGEEVHHSITEFVRCYLSGSIAGIYLRNNPSLNAAHLFLTHLHSFYQCKQMDLAASPCNIFATHIYRTSKLASESVYSVSRLTTSISELCMTKSSSNLRGLLKDIAIVLERCITIRARYIQILDSKSSRECEEYTRLHRNGSFYQDNAYENWLKEAYRTGEVIPERREARRRIIFGRTSVARIISRARNTIPRPTLFTWYIHCSMYFVIRNC